MAGPSFAELLGYGHTVISRADLWYNNSLVARGLPVSSGAIDVDSTRATRRKVDLTVADKRNQLAKLIPKTSNDRLAPYGSKIKIYRGLLLPGKREFLLPVGHFRIATNDISDTGKGISMAISGYDRARAISLNKFENAYYIAAGTDVIAAIKGILTYSQGSQSISVRVETGNTGTVAALRVIDAESDPWAVCQSLATDIGCEIYFDVNDVCVIRDQPDPSVGNVADSFIFGDASKFTQMSNSLSDDPGYNGVIVYSEAPGLPQYVGKYFDDNPNSPTYALGPYGKRFFPYHSPYIYSQAQADAAALGLFNKHIGIDAQVRMEVIPNPQLEGGSVVRAQYDDIGVNDRFLVESFILPLGEDATSSIVCRKRRFG